MQQLRRRLRYLNHLPNGYSFTLIEVELSSVVSEDVLSRFSDDLTSRQLKRDRHRLEDLRLTELKEVSENHLPSVCKFYRYLSLVHGQMNLYYSLEGEDLLKITLSLI